MKNPTSVSAKADQTLGYKIYHAILMCIAWFVPFMIVFSVPLMIVFTILMLTRLIILTPLIGFFLWLLHHNLNKSIKGKGKQAAAFFLSSILLCALIAFCVFKMDDRRPIHYLIPNGYVGTIRMEYRVPGAPKLPVEGWHYIIRISKGGRFETSSSMENDWAVDRFFYVTGSRRGPLQHTGWDGGGMIWAGDSDTDRKKESFFIGTEQQWRKADSQPGGVPQGPLDPQTLKPIMPQSK